MGAERGVYIDQSQSLNIHIEVPNYKKLTSLHFYSWRKGLKTGMYYLRTCAASEAIKFTVDQRSLQPKKEEYEQNRKNEMHEDCIMKKQANKISSETHVSLKSEE